MGPPVLLTNWGFGRRGTVRQAIEVRTQLIFTWTGPEVAIVGAFHPALK
jgi:hypothetical protein